MNNLERFKAVCRGEQPDYIPLFGFPGSPGMSLGCMKKTHDRLVVTGMPAHVGGSSRLGGSSFNTDSVDSWCRYWGTTGPIGPGFCPADAGGPGIKTKKRIEGSVEIMSKVPSLLEKGRYFPNGDHGIQPFVTFESMCQFMTLLHEVCGNPEGKFPRVSTALGVAS